MKWKSIYLMHTKCDTQFIHDKHTIFKGKSVKMPKKNRMLQIERKKKHQVNGNRHFLNLRKEAHRFFFTKKYEKSGTNLTDFLIFIWFMYSKANHVSDYLKQTKKKNKFQRQKVPCKAPKHYVLTVHIRTNSMISATIFQKLKCNQLEIYAVALNIYTLYHCKIHAFTS